MPKPLPPKKPIRDEHDPWMDADEVAEYARLKRSYVMHLARTRALRAYATNVGEKRHVWKFRKCDVDAFLERNPNVPRAPKEKPVVYEPEETAYTKPGNPRADGRK